MSALPRQGPLPRPENPDQAREVLRAESFEAPDVQRIRLEVQEFTSICPLTGQPDFGSVLIEYRPRPPAEGRCLESKSLKYYLWSFRDQGAFCENLAARIADDVVFAIEPQWVAVEVRQNVRGGIALLARAERGGPSTGPGGSA